MYLFVCMLRGYSANSESIVSFLIDREFFQVGPSFVLVKICSVAFQEF